MAGGKSCSEQYPDGVRRIVGGKTLAPRSKRRNQSVTTTRVNPRTKEAKIVIHYVSLVFLD